MLEILQFPNPILRKAVAAVANIDGKIIDSLGLMLSTMYRMEGCGLAAVQVNIPWNIITIDLSHGEQPMELINPKIVEHHGQVVSQEACLSFCGVSLAKIKRYQQIAVKYVDRDGTEQMLEAEGHLSNCLQHEIDHNNGVTIYDHVSALKKQLMMEQLRKQR